MTDWDEWGTRASETHLLGSLGDFLGVATAVSAVMRVGREIYYPDLNQKRPDDHLLRPLLHPGIVLSIG
jgi:hypothetical protein